MAFSYCLRRSSSIVPLAIRSAFDVQNSRRLLRSPPFLRRFSSTPPPSAGSPTQTSDESLGGLAFGYTDARYDKGTLFLTRKSKDEIIQVEVCVNTEYIWRRKHRGVTHINMGLIGDNEDEVGDIPCLKMTVEILYGEDFGKHLEFNVLVFPGERDRIAIRRMHMRATNGALHLEEFDDFLKKRGIEPRNFNFLFDHIDKLKEQDEDTIE